MRSFETTDIALAAFLGISDVQHLVPIVNGNKVFFRFSLESSQEALIDAFFNNDCQVRPLRYYQTILALKTRIFQLLPNKEVMSR